MLAVITSALVETLVKHMFQKELDARDRIEIGGAPSWYMMPVEDQMCVFSHKGGGMDSIEIAKENSKIKMKKKIDGLIEVVIYDNLNNIQNQKEKAVVKAWKRDSKLPVFINKNMNFSRVSYEDEIETTFVRACIPNEVMLNYQKDRLTKIKKEVLKVKVNSAFDDMDAMLNGKEQNLDPNDPFAELPN